MHARSIALYPVIDGEHMAFAFSLLRLMFMRAGNRFALGRC
jgi:hypothetical protein